MVLGLALLATVATAQTNVSSRHIGKSNAKAIVERVEAPSVDYKASIFTKARGNNVGDTLVQGFWNFDDVILSNGDTNSGYVFADAGRILTGVNDSIWMMDPDNNYAWTKSGYNPHNVLGDGGVFQFVDSNSTFFAAHAADYSGGTLNWPASRFVSYVFNNTHANYFMIYLGGPTPTDGIQHHAFFKLPAITNPGVGNLYQVRFREEGYDFIEKCYLDFKVGTEWYAIEINIDGVDAPGNGWVDAAMAYTMPAEFGNQSSLELRFRVYNDNILGNVYGVYWAFDDVAIVRAPEYNWRNYDDNFVDGAYGTVPAGMNIPLSWYGQVANAGAHEIQNATAQLYHYSPSGVKTLVTSNATPSLVANASMTQYLTLNERGFYDSVDWDGWYGYSQYYGQTTLPSTMGRHGLPSQAANIGTNYITISGVVPNNNNYDTLEFDTIGYRVVDISGGDDTSNNLIEGYRLAHDNGVIPANSLYSYGLYMRNGQRYHGNDAAYDARGYAVMVRYTTPDVIPGASENDPWVIKGIELVPQTDTTDTAIVGSQIQPIIYKLHYFDSNGSMYNRYYDVNTGLADDYTYTVKYKDVNSDLNNTRMGRIAPGEDYKAVNIRFGAQPEMEPNTAYMIGYRMAADGYFAVAQHLYGYTGATGTVRYYQDPDLAPYYYQFKPGTYDVRTTSLDNLWASYYHQNWPLIRLIVGPREEIDQWNIDAVCTDTNYRIYHVDNGYYVNMCGDTIQAYEGSDATVYVFATGDSTSVHPGIIDTIIIDGQRIAVNDIDEYDDFVITEDIDVLRNASGDVLLRRTNYIVTFVGIAENHTVSAVGHAYPFDLGIEGEAIEVSLGMRPNPATNSVTLNMRGVEGMVNCSIIDMSGRVVYNRTINAENAQTIDLSNVAAGAYFVRVTNDKFSKVEKLIVR